MFCVVEQIPNQFMLVPNGLPLQTWYRLFPGLTEKGCLCQKADKTPLTLEMHQYVPTKYLSMC